VKDTTMLLDQDTNCFTYIAISHKLRVQEIVLNFVIFIKHELFNIYFSKN